MRNSQAQPHPQGAVLIHAHQALDPPAPLGRWRRVLPPVGLSPLMNIRYDSQDPETGEPSVWILTGWRTSSQYVFFNETPQRLAFQTAGTTRMLLLTLFWLMLQQSHLDQKEKKQNPERKAGTDHTVGHRKTVSNKRRNLTMNGNISCEYLPSHEISADTLP